MTPPPTLKIKNEKTPPIHPMPTFIRPRRSLTLRYEPGNTGLGIPTGDLGLFRVNGRWRGLRAVGALGLAPPDRFKSDPEAAGTDGGKLLLQLPFHFRAQAL